MRAALAVFSAIVTLVAVDLALRAADVSCYGDLYVPDPDLGWRHLPGLRASYAKCGTPFREFRTDVRFDSLGLRGPERPVEKPAGTYRVLVLGDSFTEALQVPEEETFVAKLERRLAESGAPGGAAVDVRNAGVSGYGTDNALLAYERDLWRLQPDLVLLVMSPNDLYENTREILVNGPIPYPDKPFFVLGRRGLEVRNKPVPPHVPEEEDWPERLDRVLRGSPLYRLATDTTRPPARRDVRLLGSPTFGQRLIAEQYVAGRSPLWKTAYATTRALVRALRAAAESHGARFAVLVLADKRTFFPDGLAGMLQSLQIAARPEPELPYRQLLEAARSSDIPHAGVLPAFRRHAGEGGEPLFLRTDAHYTAAGHTVVADVAYDLLATSGLLEPSRSP